MESTLYVLLPDDVSLPRDHGLDFDISLCENSFSEIINQKQYFQYVPVGNPIKCHEEFLLLQPMFPPKRLDYS